MPGKKDKDNKMLEELSKITDQEVEAALCQVERDEKVTVTTYWKAVEGLVRRMEKEEKEGKPRFGSMEIGEDTEYKATKNILRRLAAYGVKLEGLLPVNPFGDSLNSVGGKMKEITKEFKEGAPRIGGAASYQIAKQYHKLIAHFSNSWHGGKNENTKEKVTTTTSLLQSGLRAKMPGENKAGYQEAYDAAVVLDGRIKKYEKEQEEKLESKKAVAVEIASSDKATVTTAPPALAVETQQPPTENTPPLSLEEQRQQKIKAKEAKLSEVKAMRDTINQELKAIHALMYFMIESERKGLNIPQAIPDIGVKSGDSAVLAGFKDSAELNALRTPTAFQADKRKLSLQFLIEAQLKFMYDVQRPAVWSNDVYKKLESLLNEASKKKWASKSRTSYLTFEGENRRELVAILLAEIAQRAEHIKGNLKKIDEISIETEVAEISRLEEALKQQAEEKALLEDRERIRNEGLTALRSVLESFKPITATEKDSASTKKMLSDTNVKESKKVQLMRGMLYEAIGEELKKDPASVDVEKLKNILRNADDALQTSPNEQAVSNLKQYVEVQPKSSTKKKVWGALAIACGYLTKNDDLQKRGWVAYTSGQYYKENKLHGSLRLFARHAEEKQKEHQKASRSSRMKKSLKL